MRPTRFSVILLILLLSIAPVSAKELTPEQQTLLKQREVLQQLQKKRQQNQMQENIAARKWDARTLEQLATLFPEAIKAKTGCYNAAISNYVENHWADFEKEESCPATLGNCKDLNDALKKLGTTNETLKKAFGPLKELDAGKNAYQFVLPMLDALTPNNRIDAFNPNAIRNKAELGVPDVPANELQARLGDLNQYIGRCDKLRAISWSRPGYTEIPDLTLLAENKYKRGIYSLLMQAVIGSKLPEEKAGYVGCLVRLNEMQKNYSVCPAEGACTATMPDTPKDVLLNRLDDLKTRGCTDDHATEVAYHLVHPEAKPDAPIPPAIEDQSKEMPSVMLTLISARAQNQRFLDDLVTYYGPHLGGHNAACYRAAVSSFIDDQWAAIDKQTGCDSNKTFCSEQRDNDFTGMSVAIIDLKRGQLHDDDFRKAIIALKNTQVASGKMFMLNRAMRPAMISESMFDSYRYNTPPKPKMEKITAEGQEKVALLEKYLGDCASKKPAAWAVPGESMDALAKNAGLSKIAYEQGMYKMLVSSLIGKQVPAEQVGAIGCLNEFYMINDPYKSFCEKDVQCLETMHSHDKASIGSLLGEFKTHQCGITFLRDRSVEYQSPLPRPAKPAKTP